MKTRNLIGRAWLGLYLSTVMVGAAAETPPLHSGVVTLDIKPQSIGAALNDFAQQSGLQVLFYSEVTEGLRTSAVVGTFTAHEALLQLLSSTGLTYSKVNERTVAIHRVTSTAAEREAIRSELRPPAMQLADLRLADQGDGNRGPASSDRAIERSEAKPLRIEEIVVTATKREERVQDIPVSIAVINNQDIARRGLIGMEDYLRAIPGVNQIDNGGLSNTIVIRGITTALTDENYSAGTTVASYFDETPITGTGGLGGGGLIDVRPVDIERIEVLRGPQGTAYGSASVGGVMRIIPVKPKFDGFDANVTGSLSGTEDSGSENSMIQGVLNIPIIKDKFAARASAYRYDESGFYRNVAGNDAALIAIYENFGLGDLVRGHVQEDVGQMVSTGGRLAALWQVTDDLELTFNFLTQQIEQDGQPLSNRGGFEQSRAPVASQARVRGRAGEVNDTEMDLAGLVLKYNLGWAALTSTVSWIDSGSTYAFDFSNSFLLPLSAVTPSDYKSITSETRLASQLEGPLQFLGGFYYEDVEDSAVQSLYWPGTPAADNPFGTDPIGIFDTRRERDQLAVFGEIFYDLTDKITASVGGRYFEYDKSDRSLFEGGLVGVPVGAGEAQVMESSESDSTFKARLSYEPTEDSLLYVSWAEGFRLGQPTTGANPFNCDTDSDGVIDGTSTSVASTRTVQSDFIDTYEIGAKFALFDRRLVVEATAYHNDWRDLPVRTTSTPACNWVANVGEGTSDGVELQASLFVAEGVKVAFGAGYTDAELSKDAPGLVGSPEEGARLPGSPKVSANLSAQYDFEVAGYNAFVRADSFYSGKFYSDLLETPDLSSGDYVKIDARAGVAIRNVSLELFVRNLTDEDAYTVRLAGAYGDYRLRPRTVGLQLGYNF